jgi:hypothetical protein
METWIWKFKYISKLQVTVFPMNLPVDKSDLVIVFPGAASQPLGHVFPPGHVQISVVVSYMVSFCPSFGHCVVCPSSFGHCVVCPSSIYGFCLPLWYLQALPTRVG